MMFLSLLLFILPSQLLAQDLAEVPCEASTPENQDRGYKLVDDTVQVCPSLLDEDGVTHQGVYILSASLLLFLIIIIWSAIPASQKSGVNTQIRKRLFNPKVSQW